jgi:hypothetical protein
MRKIVCPMVTEGVSWSRKRSTCSYSCSCHDFPFLERGSEPMDVFEKSLGRDQRTRITSGKRWRSSRLFRYSVLHLLLLLQFLPMLLLLFLLRFILDLKMRKGSSSSACFDLIRKVMESKTIQESLKGDGVIVQDLNTTAAVALPLFLTVPVPSGGGGWGLMSWILAMKRDLSDRMKRGV